ncbi:MAG: ORF6N domain-containing protein [Elusimicrobia bacterium]|nr:ORF6N domain-containing protein [Elusimicrobiota bacterium]
MKPLVPTEDLNRRIFLIRGHRVMLSGHLAELYGVEPRALVQAVKRNIERFPADFLFRLTLDEAKALRSQSVILNDSPDGLRPCAATLRRGRHIKFAPYAFTEQGVAMLSSVLRSRQAIQVNIAIMRAFVRLWEVLATHKDLAKRLESIERHLAGHDADLGKQAEEIRKVFEAINELREPPVKPRPQIGFQPHKK